MGCFSFRMTPVDPRATGATSFSKSTRTLLSGGLVAHGWRVGDSRAISKRLMSLVFAAAGDFVFRFSSLSYMRILEWVFLLAGMPPTQMAKGREV